MTDPPTIRFDDALPISAAVDEIAGCPGVDGVFVGPYDLSLSLGRPLVVDDEVVAAIATVVASARRLGELAGAYSGNRALEPLLPPLDRRLRLRRRGLDQNGLASRDAAHAGALRGLGGR